MLIQKVTERFARVIFVIHLTLALLPVGPASAQDTSWTLTQKDKDLVGIVQVFTGVAGLDPTAGSPAESGTGVLISASGHVLTAAHLFSNADWSLCTERAEADRARVCRIYFLWHGDPEQKFQLSIASARQPGHDYVILKLAPPPERIGKSTWPRATLGKQVADGEAIFATGYTGSDAPILGGANAIDTSAGRLRADMAPACSNSFGIARNTTAVTSPGYSGGPVFNRSHRVVGIVLGQACAVGGEGDLRDAPRSRVLLIQDMPQLCVSIILPCFFGYDGDTETFNSTNGSAWFDRLISGSGTAERYVFGWKMREISRLTNYYSICAHLLTDTELVEEIETRAVDGAQLAIVYYALWQRCRPGALPSEIAAARERVDQLAEAGYEPAQYFEAAMIQSELAPKLVGRKSPDDPVPINDSDRKMLFKAERYLRHAATHRWSAASLVMFDLCRMRVIECSRGEAEAFLTAAVADGQRDALRTEAIARIVGETDSARRKMGFTRPQDFTRAIAFLKQAATPATGVSKNPLFTSYDNGAAGFLAYFYWGGKYAGQTVVDANVVLAQAYGQGCLGGMSGPSPAVEFCGMIDAIGRFNQSTDVNVRRGAWLYIQTFSGWAPIAGELARNLLTWSQDGSDISKILCDLNEDLAFAPSGRRLPDVKGIASCYHAAAHSR